MKLEIRCGWAQPYKTIAKFIVHSIGNPKPVLLQTVKTDKMQHDAAFHQGLHCKGKRSSDKRIHLYCIKPEGIIH